MIYYVIGIENLGGKSYILIFEFHSPTVTEQLKHKYKMEKCLGEDKTILSFVYEQQFLCICRGTSSKKQAKFLINSLLY